MPIFSGGSKYPPFYVHSALTTKEAKFAGKKNDCVTCKHGTDIADLSVFNGGRKLEK